MDGWMMDGSDNAMPRTRRMKQSNKRDDDRHEVLMTPLDQLRTVPIGIIVQADSAQFVLSIW